MNKGEKISVAIATYNGEKFIKKQLETILKQLTETDEVIISDDGSTDNTIKIIESFNDKRIKIIKGPKLGVKQNFANAIEKCSGKYIFLADQDDIWNDNKIKTVLNAFNDDNVICVVHNCEVFNSNDNSTILDSYFDYRKSKPGIIKNIIKNSYIGCCMAFNSSIKEKILPIPNDIYMHDLWIGIICEMNGKTKFIDDKLIKYRRHDSNLSSLKHHSIMDMIKNRVVLIRRIVGR